MKRYLMILVWLLFGVILFSAQAQAVCPQDTVDSGICDTMYVEIYPQDSEIYGLGPYLTRFPIFVTHDLPDENIDSLTAFFIPLCYTHSNPAKYCSVSFHWNTTALSGSSVSRSIFRHLPSMDDPQIRNWMMDQYSVWREWDTKILNIDGTSHFWLSLIASGADDQRFWGGSRVLIATMTFKLQDTMEIHIDSCFWPPAGRLAFGRSDAQSFIPRHFLPVSGRVRFPGESPFFNVCPGYQWQHTNGTGFQSGEFSVSKLDGMVIDVTASFIGSGVATEHIVFTVPPPAALVEGYVVYDVVDHCQGGGVINLRAQDDLGATTDCSFPITLTNYPPYIVLPDTILAPVGSSLWFTVYVSEPDHDLVTEYKLNAFWYAQDSLKLPAHPPSYAGGNNGLFTWVPTQADTGAWIASFSATDNCGAIDTHLLNILQSIPFCGDCNNDSAIGVADVISMVNYLYRGGILPEPSCRGDANGDGQVDAGDVVYLINYLYRYGMPPDLNCCGD